MRALRIIFFAALALVSSAVIGIGVLVATFDANRYKSEIEQLVREQTGRTMHIQGDIDLTLFPKLGAVIGKTTLTEKDPQQPFLTFTTIRASVSLTPLLRGQVLVDGITIDGLEANIRLNKEGKLNFLDLWSTKASATTHEEANRPDKKPAANSSVAQPLRFDINSIAITNANVTYRDERDGLDLVVSNLDLQTGRLAPDARGRLALSAAVTSQKLALETTISLRSNYMLDLSHRLAELEKLQFKTKGQWQDFKIQDSDVSLSLQANLAAPAYKASNVSIQFNIQDSNQTLKGSATTAEILMDESTITAKPSRVKLDLASATGMAKRRINGEIQLPGFVYVNDKFLLRGLEAALAVSSSGMGDRPWLTQAKGDLSVDVRQETLNTNIKGQLDGSPFKVALDVHRFSQPKLTFDVELDQLNLDRLGDAGLANAANKPAGVTAPSPVTTTPSPMDLSLLKGHQAEGRLSIQQVSGKGFALHKVNANIVLDQGRLSVGPHSAELFGGKLSGSFLIDSHTERFTIQETISNIQINELLTALEQAPRLMGQGSLTMDLTTTGTTSHALEQNLTGTASVQLRDGAIKGIDINAILNNVRSLLGKAPAKQGTTGGQTTFTEMTASVSIQNGIATNRDLRVKAPLFRVEGHGTINLAQSSVDYLAKVAVVETSTGQGGADLATLRGLTIPVRITGRLDKPNYQVDIDRLAAELAKSQLGGKAQQEINKVVPGLGDALRGLFGR